ncbi:MULTISPECIES: hypothetical protein [Halorussus]|uniref:hypothetical protein n=1 Tax=Halorussus TaxID=1070314 RepID=UPI00209D13D8|nr:hypothetical protein [Halorussus vallis]USZ78028.1 hypothetical protein NGM07_20410 [Halorussus vallis]
MTTFVEDVRAIPDGDAAALTRRLTERIETIGEALDLLEEWTEASRTTRTELASQYEAAKTLARDEIREATGESAEDLPAEDLLDHPAVDDQTKRRLREYSTKLFVYLDEESSYGEARSELLRSLGDELDLYKRLLPELESGETSVGDARERIAAFAREEIGPDDSTAADVVLESTPDAEE